MRSSPLLPGVVLAATLATSACGNDEPDGGAPADRAVCGLVGYVMGVDKAARDVGNQAASRMASTWNESRDEVATTLPEIEDDGVRKAAQAVADAPDAVDGIGTSVPTVSWLTLSQACSSARIDADRR